ncbi:MAG TPA: LamG-like jellyroll fold domain-containing protein [Methylomirabilota bacterium]|nr:LamG-like jellyroll fold domain-containing protein [Methylomirabilota bacterium]
MTPLANAADLRQGLVAYWQLNETDGFITPDATPFNNHLTLVGMGGGNFVPGQFDNAAQFNGSSTYMTNLHSPDPSISGLPIYRAGSYTITMWVKGAAQVNRYLYSEASTTSNNPLLILQTGNAANSSKFDVIIRTDGNATLVNHVVSSAVVFDDTWHHIAWVDDRGSVRLYIDGVLDAANFNYIPSGTFTMNTTTLGLLVRAAVAPAANVFNGLIDDVGVWKRALSAAEVEEVRISSIATPIPEFPAEIVVQPVGSTNRIGDRVTLSATADGNPPLSFQWFKNGAEILGATAASITLSHLTTSDSGDYTLQVTNRFGTNLSSVATLLVTPDAAPDLRQGIVSHWGMDDEVDDGTGRGALLDVYGHNDFKVVADGGFIDLGPGHDINAAIFDGIHQYAYRDGGFPIYNNTAYSVAFWINANGAGQSDRRIFSETSTNNNNPALTLGTQAAGTNGAIRVFVRNNAATVLLDRTSTGTPLDGTWHHVVWTETNGEARLYIDGLLDETSFHYTRGSLSLDTTTIGALLNASGASNFFSGSIDELAVWSRAISFTEVQEIFTLGIPFPIGDIPPTITADPASQSVFTRANVTFAFAATGTGPLFSQWRKDGLNLLAETNTTLVLSNVTLADAGNYDVVVTNTVGGATSQVAALSVTLRPVTSELKIDFNNLGVLDDTPVNTEPGFSSFALATLVTQGPVTRTYGGAEVTLSPVGGIIIESRKRAAPVNSGPFTEEKLLQDFIFARDTVLDQGLDVLIEFLEPNQLYNVTVWSYDNGSVTADRISDWFANGTLVQSGYSFFGSNLPTSNDHYRFNFNALTGADGRLLIAGRRNGAATGGINVFINALSAVRSEMRIQRIEFLPPGALRLLVEVINPAANHGLEQTTDLENPVWSPVVGASFAPPVGNVIEVSFGVPDTDTRFYRIVQIP